MAKLLVILLLPAIAFWTPMNRCCLTNACDNGGAGGEMAAHARATPTTTPAPAPAPAPAGHGCGACADATAEATRPTTPAPADHDDCTCDPALAAAPSDRDAVAPTATHPHLLPAFDLWGVLPWTPGPADAAGFVRRADHDIGPPHAPARSLHAQACLLTI